MAERYVLGVDGGGSKTEAVLARVDADGRLDVLETATTGPSNLQREPFEASLEQVARACHAVLEAHPDHQRRVDAACFAMAGSGNTILRERFRHWVGAQAWAAEVQVTHDARPLVAAGTREDYGIALIAGTGSFAYGRTADGRERGCGGWGRIVGDEGSGYALAIAGMRAALFAHDGRGAATLLLDDFRQWFAGDPPSGWPKSVADASADVIAAGARVVTAAAEAGDRVAMRLVHQCADDLVRMVVTLRDRQFADEPVEVALAGGLLCGSPLVYQQVVERLGPGEGRFGEIRRVPHPSHGAARLAALALAEPLQP